MCYNYNNNNSNSNSNSNNEEDDDDDDDDEQAERERLEREEQERLEQERLEQERLEQERLEQERLEKEEQERANERDERRRRKERERKQKEQELIDRRERKKARERQSARQKALEERLAQRQNEDPSFVERIPKRSALLALGREAYQKHRQQIKEAARKEWHANPARWRVTDGITFDGGFACQSVDEVDRTVGSLREAVDEFAEHPETYVALYYPARADPSEPQKVTFVLREGTTLFRPKDVRTDGSGTFCLHQHCYQRLMPFPFDSLPKEDRDEHTDSMTFEGSKLHSESRLPILPGRGMGLADAPHTKLLGKSSNDHDNDTGNGKGTSTSTSSSVLAEPNDVVQGTVGDCWLLSAIACLADFDFAVERLFRKTKHKKHLLPRDGKSKSKSSDDDGDDDDDKQGKPRANSYTVTLWDLTTWKEVDVVVDERLPIRPTKKAAAYSELLGAKPSYDGKLWVPYLEKAIAIHCGGYDKLVGGNCTNAWPMLTGSRNQYVIQKNPRTKLYGCSARFDSRTEEWTPHTNSPHDSDQSLWSVPWPRVGGGGDADTELTQEELFDRIVAWDETNYLIGAGTDGSSDQESTDGIVDNHAYSVIDSKHDVGGTGIDLLLVRNPWGHGGGLTNGLFMVDGPGWKQYPSVKYELAPIPKDTGLFWLTRDEFFRYFPTIYLCKFNTTRLRDEDYTNDLSDEFVRTKKAKPKPKKKKPRPQPVQQELPPLEPWFVNKQSDPNSPYKIVEQIFNGGVSYVEMNKRSIKGKSIPEAVEEFRSNPDKYLAIHFQTSMVEEGWPIEVHQYTFIYREGTQGIQVEVTPTGKRTILTNVLR